MKKVIIVNHYGGTGEEMGTTRHFDMARELAKEKDVDVEYWICGYNHFTGQYHSSFNKWYKIYTKTQYENLKVIRIKSTKYNKKNSIFRQINISIFSFISGVKLLFTKNVKCCLISFPPLSFLNIIVAKIKKIKLIVDIEDLWPLFLQDMGLDNKLVVKIMEKVADYAYNSADIIQGVSLGILNYVNTRINNQHKKYILSPLGVNISEYSDKNSYDLSIIKSKDWNNKFKIMYIGALNPANNLLEVLKLANAMREFKEIAFIIIGDGGERENLIKYKEKYNLNNVYIEQPISSKDVPMYLSQANICITNLKKIESFKLVRPNKLFQYMAMSKLIISGIEGEFERILDEAQAGYTVDFSRIDDVKELIINLYNDPSIIDEKGKNGRLYIEEHGNRESIINNFCKLIKDTI